MQELFSCRNCIHDAGQSLNIGRGQGFCLKHDSLLDAPADMTCKYQHRKDLPHFVVDEARREHAAEFAGFPGIVRLTAMEPVRRTPYSERFGWDHGAFDPVTNALANYHKGGRSWVYIQTFAGGVDGQRALVHSCLTRRYLDHCATWSSSYRLILSVVDEMVLSPRFSSNALQVANGDDLDEVEADARWDVFFARLTGLQEYGWHAGVEELMWASDSLNGSLSELDWDGVLEDLDRVRPHWIETIIRHAQDNDAYFTQQPEDDDRPGG